MEIGKYTYGKPNIFWGGKHICKIGNYTSIANNLNIYLGGNHNINWVTTYPFGAINSEKFNTFNVEEHGHPFSKGDVIIGNDVWIGSNVTIMSGVTIGDGCVIANNSHVVKDAEPYTLIGGNPAKIVKYRFTDEQIKQLLKIKWWNWDESIINEHLHLLCNTNIDTFIERANVLLTLQNREDQVYKMKSIQDKFQQLSNTESDINEHLHTLSKYASECESIFESGVRGCISSWAFINGLLNNNSLHKTLFMNDIDECNINELLSITKDLPMTIKYEWKNNLELDMKERYDLTFIDTWHIYGQLKRELEKFAPITNKFIIMHDTTIDEFEGETIRRGWNATEQSIISGFPVEEINKGLWPAIEEFIASTSEWVIHERFTHNNGLTILRRI